MGLNDSCFYFWAEGGAVRWVNEKQVTGLIFQL